MMKNNEQSTSGNENDTATQSTKPKENRRSKQKYPALDTRFNLKTRTELIDYDYVNQLSEKDKAWLNKFTEEYTNARFNKNPKKNLHNSKELIQDCYNRNNARNRDIMTKAKAMGALTELSQTSISKSNFETTTEDTMIETIQPEKAESPE